MQKNKFKYFYILILFITTLNGADMRSLLFHGNCVTCHNEHKSISAPSIDKVKESYLRAFPLKKDFVAYMAEWIVKPNAKTSIMQGAIKKYELMPELGFDLSTSNEISAYIYDTDFSKEHVGHKY